VEGGGALGIVGLGGVVGYGREGRYLERHCGMGSSAVVGGGREHFVGAVRVVSSEVDPAA
jgi:hypothetical protein